MTLKIANENKNKTGNNLTFLNTLNDIMLNKETLPPDADITYESFLDRAKQALDSSGLQSFVSFVIGDPFVGCHN